MTAELYAAMAFLSGPMLLTIAVLAIGGVAQILIARRRRRDAVVGK